MKTPLRIVLCAAAAALLSPPAWTQESSASCGRHAQVDARGDHVMGFDHAETTHHFRLTASGGVIDVSANDPEDAASRDAIRTHLAHIAVLFAEGDFEAPMLIHDRVPPGVPVMQREKKTIRWTYEETPAGGRVLATTKDAAALSAIHEFLRFQIEDHRTGDSTDVTRP
jgi:hypothetical protein